MRLALAISAALLVSTLPGAACEYDAVNASVVDLAVAQASLDAATTSVTPASATTELSAAADKKPMAKKKTAKKKEKVEYMRIAN